MENPDEHDATLKQPLAALRSSMDCLDAPRGVEKELMQAFGERHRRKWHHRMPLQWRLAGGLGSICAAVLVLLVAEKTSVPAFSPVLGTLDSGTAFIALDTLERVESDAAPRLVEADIPSSTLAAAGVPVAPELAGGMVRAELLIGADGEPLAVRLLAN